MQLKNTALALAIFMTQIGMPAKAGLLEDDEARRAILELRSQISALEGRMSRVESANQGQLTLAQSLEQKDREIAKLRGDLEVALNQLQKLRDDNRVLYSSLEERIKKLEPETLEIAGRSVKVNRDQARDYSAANELIKSGNVAEAGKQFQNFLASYPGSPLTGDVKFFLGFTQYAQGDYKASIVTQREMVKEHPDHPRAADALLSVASSQIELKAVANAKKTLAEIVDKYPDTPAAATAKTRLAALK